MISSVERLGRAFFQVLLRAYPRPFRREYGAEMTRVFVQRLRDVSARGAVAMLRFIGAAICDLATTAAAEWRDASHNDRSGARYRRREAHQRRDSMSDRLLHDLQDAWRSIRKAPGFAATIVITLALGIGANTTIFSLVQAVLLKNLPYRDPEGLVTVWATDPRSSLGDMRGLGGRRGDPRVPLSPPALADLAARSRSFAELAGFSPAWAMSATGAGRPEPVDAAFVTERLFDLLGFAPEAGRAFAAAEHRSGAPRVVVVSRALWDRRFPGASLAGQTITLDGNVYTIIGIMPRGVELPNTASSLWIPFTQNPFATRREIPITYVVGRLRPGVTREAAESELSSIAAAFAREFPAAHGGRGLTIVPLHQMVVGEVRTLLLVLFGAVGCLILIACANVANLFLARATARNREIAVRAALGASRGQIVQQLIAESVLLAVCGGIVGTVVGWWGTSTFVSLFAARLPRASEVRVDAGVLLFASVLSVATGILFGLAPALRASRVDLNDTLKESARTDGAAALRLRSVLVVGEVALSLMLLCGAGLLFRSFYTLTHVDPGFRVDHIVQVDLSPSPIRYATGPQRVGFYGRLIGRLRELPGVQRVGAVNRLPLAGSPNNVVNVSLDGEDVSAANARPVDRRVATPEYFAVMDIPVVSGRPFDERDDTTRPPVAIVNRAMARRFWPGNDPLGHRVRIGLQGGTGPWIEIVGVVGDVRHRGLDVDVNPELYVPYAQAMVQGMTVVVRTSSDPRSLIEAVRAQVWSVDREEVMLGPSTMEDVLAVSVAQPRSRTLVFSLFAGLAVLLAAVGIYGVVAYTVTRMTRDIGIRVALGAAGGDIMRMVVVRGLGPVVIGLVVGLSGAALLSRFTRTLLFQVSPTDPATYAAVTVILLTVATAAAFLPARRAARVDPVIALRIE